MSSKLKLMQEAIKQEIAELEFELEELEEQEALESNVESEPG
jgi:hypothetical protein